MEPLSLYVYFQYPPPLSHVPVAQHFVLMGITCEFGPKFTLFSNSLNPVKALSMVLSSLFSIFTITIPLCSVKIIKWSSNNIPSRILLVLLW